MAEDVIGIVQSVTVLLATLAALYGINAWRRELIGRKRLELAEEVLARFYRARDAVRVIRNPFSSESEGKSRTQSESESPAESEDLDNAYVVFERYNENREVFNELYALRYRFMVHHGQEAGGPFEDLRKTVNRIFIAARMLPRYWRDLGRALTDEEVERNAGRIKEQEAIFWEQSPDDEINLEIDATVRRIEAICLPSIQQAIAQEKPLWRRILRR